MWKQIIAKRIRLGMLVFVLLVCGGIANHRHLLSGVSGADLTIALGCVLISITPVFITMGHLLKDTEPEVA